MTLLEREGSLNQLRQRLIGTRDGRGHLVLVAGEAGIGKTALIETFCAEQGARVQVLWGTCDAVVPPRPFAPLADMADRIGGSLRAALDAGDRDRVFDSFLALLRQSSPMQRMVVLDDLHWADEATFDLLRVAGRRLRQVPVLLIGTYRDDEVGREHCAFVVRVEHPDGSARETQICELSDEPVMIPAFQGAPPTRTFIDEQGACVWFSDYWFYKNGTDVLASSVRLLVTPSGHVIATSTYPAEPLSCE